MSGGAIRHGSGKLAAVYLGPAELIQLRHRLTADVEKCGPGCAGEAAQSCDYRLLLALLEGYEALLKDHQAQAETIKRLRSEMNRQEPQA